MNGLRSLLQGRINQIRRSNPDTMNWTADEWIDLFESAAQSHGQLSVDVDEQDYLDELAELSKHPDFHRVMVELEDDRLFDEPILN